MQRTVRHAFRRLAPGLWVAVAACQTWQPQPLEPEQVLEEIHARRAADASFAGQPLHLLQAVAAAREHNPAIRAARAAYAVEQSVADVKTPLPNPTIDAGLLFFGSGFDVLDSADRLLEGGLGWAVPLGGWVHVTDDRNAARAEAALVDAGGVERTEYLALRAEVVSLARARRLLRAREELAATVETSLETTRRLADAGQNTALDVRLMELELERARGAVREAQEAAIEAAADVAARTGLPLARVGEVEDAQPPEATPTMEQLSDVLLRDHPGLAARRARYLVAEQQLRLEIARQYPSLDVGVPLEREGSTRFGLSLGIELPLFDRNQPAIAEARARREEIRVGYEAEAQRAVSAIEAGLARLDSALERLAWTREQLVPAADRTVQTARASLTAGEAPALQFLAVLRDVQEVEIERIEAETRVLEAWLDLEEACGAPLLTFEAAKEVEQ